MATISELLCLLVKLTPPRWVSYTTGFGMTIQKITFIFVAKINFPEGCN
jgi:hypothetical protein